MIKDKSREVDSVHNQHDQHSRTETVEPTSGNSILLSETELKRDLETMMRMHCTHIHTNIQEIHKTQKFALNLILESQRNTTGENASGDNFDL